MVIAAGQMSSGRRQRCANHVPSQDAGAAHRRAGQGAWKKRAVFFFDENAQLAVGRGGVLLRDDCVLEYEQAQGRPQPTSPQRSGGFMDDWSRRHSARQTVYRYR